MQIERLEENKIQVILSTADLLSMNIDISTLSGESGELNSFLFYIMEQIKEETGFNPYGGQLLMEAMPMGEDGISILVSKVHNEKEKITRAQFKRIRALRPRMTREKDALEAAEHVEVFYISCFDDVCAALMELNHNTLLMCALYKLDSVYVILIAKNDATMRDIDVLSEFSYRQSYYPLQEVYIREHGELIAKGKRLISLADGIGGLYRDEF